jgi:2-keto-4-pentenoate hydratase
MAGKLSVYQANRVLNKLLRGEDYVVPAAYWIGLFKASNDIALRANTIAAADEVTAVGYVRKKIRDDAPVTFTASTAAASQLSGTVTWDTAAAAWGTVTFAAITDAPTGGNIILYGALTTPKPVDSGDVFRLPSGLFTVAM